MNQSNYYFQILVSILGKSQRIDNLDFAIIESAEFLEFLTKAQLTSTFFREFKKLYPDFDYSPSVKSLLLKTTALQSLLETESRRIIQEFNVQNILVLGLKGNFLAEIYQDKRFHKDSGDIDLLIKKQDVFPALFCLNQLGFQEKTKLSRFCNFLNQQILHSIELINPATGVNLDLHWALAERFYLKAGFAELAWEHDETIQNQNLRILTLSPRHNLIFLCLQAYKDQYFSLASLYQIYLLNKKYSFELLDLEPEITTFDLRLICEHALAYSRELFDEKNSNPHPVTSETKHLFSKRENISSYLRILFFRYLLPFGSDFDLRLPCFLEPLYFIYKPVKLMLKALGYFVKKITG